MIKMKIPFKGTVITCVEKFKDRERRTNTHDTIDNSMDWETNKDMKKTRESQEEEVNILALLHPQNILS